MTVWSNIMTLILQNVHNAIILVCIVMDQTLINVLSVILQGKENNFKQEIFVLVFKTILIVEFKSVEDVIFHVILVMVDIILIVLHVN